MNAKMNKIRVNIDELINTLESQYPDATCSLIFDFPFQLLIAGRLSAQCTDKRVNITTKVLFNKYKSLDDFANANVDDIKAIIKPCGLVNSKAENIVNMCKILIEDFESQIPDNIEDLVKLPGIGRKTANLILGEIFKKPAVICDTHCIRISNLLGLTDSKNPEIVENDLRKILPPEKSCSFCHMMVSHGREVCKARKPLCKSCVIKNYCLSFKNSSPKT